MMELLLSRSEAQGMVIKEDSTEGRDNECRGIPVSPPVNETMKPRSSMA